MRALTTLLVLTLLPLTGIAGPLNDTGIGFCRDHASGTDSATSASTTCTPLPTHGAQDAHYGRDAAAVRGVLGKVGAGGKGFEFTKIANDGSVLPASVALGSNPGGWACTYDNNTGLMWEVKTTSGLRNQAHSYTWYDSVHNYLGSPGTPSGGTCETSGRCDTEKYVDDVNGSQLCGHADWRMPTLQELFNLADRGVAAPGPTIDADYFPNTPAEDYWSGTPDVFSSNTDLGYAWVVRFNDGSDAFIDFGNNWNERLRIRLVRSGR